jgi:hypothetical protein
MGKTQGAAPGPISKRPDRELLGIIQVSNSGNDIATIVAPCAMKASLHIRLYCLFLVCSLFIMDSFGWRQRDQLVVVGADVITSMRHFADAPRFCGLFECNQ